MGSYDTDEEREIEEDRAMIAVGNRLSMDLVEGNGPDMIVNGASFGMLNNEDYLMDLSSYAQENLGSGEYFTSVIDAARVDGILYQLPLSFSITGISVPESDVEPGQIGFTYDQYREFVEGPCNGVNPISGGQLSLFVTALNTIQDLVITDNQVNYDTEAFRALAEYVLENVNDDLVYDDGEDDYSMGGDDGPCLVYVTDVRDYYSNVVDRDNVLLGVPSFDGRGPIIFGSDSIAVSADTDSEEGCLEFISLVMGAEAQEEFGMTNGIPVNRAAFDEVGARLIQAQNDELEDLLRYYSEDELRMYGYSASVMDEAAIDSLAGIIDTLTGWYTNDGAVNAIIREEMAAYFEGQKTLDQVIPVLQDRVQNVLNERAS